MMMEAVSLAGGHPVSQVLDMILRDAVAHARAADPTAETDRWRGLHLDPNTAATLVRGDGLLAGFRADIGPLVAVARRDRALGTLADLYGLTDLAIAALALALAPEIDARYGRIFGYLQDDITRRLPTPALAIDLFCDGDDARDRGRLVFASGSALAAQQLLLIEPPPNETALTAPLLLDPQIRQFLLGEPGIDPRLARCCVLRSARSSPPDLVLEPALTVALARAAESLRLPSAVPLRLLLLGPPGCGQDEAADALAEAAGLPVLGLDARALAAETSDTRVLLAIFRREALLANALVRIRHPEALEGEAHAHLRALLRDELPRLAPAVVLACPAASWLADAADTAGFAPLIFAPPSADLRRRLWHERAADQGLALSQHDIDTLALRFRLTPAQIGQAAARAAMTLRWQDEDAAGDAPLLACLAAAPAQGGHDLARLAKRVSPRFSWADIVTTPAVAAQLREICDRVRFGATVLERWRFADKLALGRGISALFAGPSGTGKTMAAEVIAGALGLPLFKIDLAAVVSKYIGETEQNLDRIFRAAEDVNGILLFDEADALFGKRSEVQDSRDRYANLEISYLLQKMEEFEGVAILSTNLQNNLDDAFTRRLSFIVHFPFPDAAHRERIWDVVWPHAVPREPGLRFARIAEACKLSGGNIKSAALGAAYYAAAEGTAVGIRHVLRAVAREYEKLGRPLKPEEIASILAKDGGMG
jgi:AAA+ superfamily predicted ATPase